MATSRRAFCLSAAGAALSRRLRAQEETDFLVGLSTHQEIKEEFPERLKRLAFERLAERKREVSAMRTAEDDAHCQMQAEAAGSEGKTWRAYLSTTGGDEAVNARDRIGDGPWYNANGVMVAENVDDLHSDDNKLSKENSISASGEEINGRGDSPNRHDILTGTELDGTASAGGLTCDDWTSNASDGSALVGHHDRTGGGANPTSWNNAHPSRGCGQADLQGTGGDGLFYCFAID